MQNNRIKTVFKWTLFAFAVMFAIFTPYELVCHGSSSTYLYMAIFSGVLLMVKGLDLSVLDITPRFYEAEKPLSLFPRHGLHYNEAGYQIVADKLLNYLNKAMNEAKQ